MRRALDVLLVLAMLAVFISTANPSPAYADDTASLSSVATFSVDGPSSLLAPSSEPAQWWGGWGWGGWPWWAGMPLWQISAMTGYTWPWAYGPPLFLAPPLPPLPPLGVTLFNVGLLSGRTCTPRLLVTICR